MNREEHWQGVWETKPPTQVSWFRPQLDLSLAMIADANLDDDAPVIDVGGGGSTLVDDLLAQGFRCVTVLDISEAALNVARERLDAEANLVIWIVTDVLYADFPSAHYRLWHDRATFHFLTDERDRQTYVRILQDALAPEAHVIIGTFATDGPKQCSGLDTMRYSPEGLGEVLGPDFRLVDSTGEAHVTPSGGQQNFLYCHFVYSKSPGGRNHRAY